MSEKKAEKQTNWIGAGVTAIAIIASVVAAALGAEGWVVASLLGIAGGGAVVPRVREPKPGAK